MKKFFPIVMAAFMTLAMVSCESDNGETGSGSKELANTQWQYDNPNDEAVYGLHVLYTLTFGATNQVTFEQNIEGSTATMAGTYEYSNGKGKCYVKHTEGDDQNEYWLTFTVSNDVLTLKVSGRDIEMNKIK